MFLSSGIEGLEIVRWVRPFNEDLVEVLGVCGGFVYVWIGFFPLDMLC